LNGNTPYKQILGRAGSEEITVKRRILLVDDNELFLDSARDVLESEGYTVITAESGEQALARVRAEYFPVVIMDIKMAGLSGVATFIEMKKYRPGIRVIMCTAHLMEDLIHSAEEEGAFAVLKKPFSTEVLLEAMERAFRAE
jgi:DNA-binding NtrC family response regulator